MAHYQFRSSTATRRAFRSTALMRPLVMRSTRSAMPAITALCVMIVVGGDEIVIAEMRDATRRRIESAEDVEQRRFAAAGGSEDDEKLALVELEVGAL
jgi:hypothetical protein